MSEIEFDSDIDSNPRYSARPGSAGVSASQGNRGYYQQPTSQIGMVNWLIQHGIISGENGAKALLIGFIAMNFIAAGLVLYFFVLR